MNAQTVTSSTFVEPRFILKGVSWQTFKALMAEVGDDRAWRIAYDEGVLELRMPLTEHEEPKGLIEDFVTSNFADWLEWSHQQWKAQQMNPDPVIIRLRERIAKYGRDPEVHKALRRQRELVSPINTIISS